MAFEVQTSQLNTVASYGVSRLGSAQVLRTGMAETSRGWLPARALSAADLDSDEVFEELHLLPVVGLASADALVGREVIDATGVSLGVVTAAVDVPASGDTPRVWRATVTGGLSGSAEVPVSVAQFNFFGIQVNNPVGRSWELVLSSDVPAQAARMQSMLVGIQVQLVTLACAALGVSKTQDQILAAAIAMIQSGNSVDSVIASEMEQLEKDRRSGSFANVTVVGSAPAA